MSATDEGAVPEETTEADLTAGHTDDDLVREVDDLEAPAGREGPQGGIEHKYKF